MKKIDKQEYGWVVGLILFGILSGFTGCFLYHHKATFHWPLRWPVTFEERVAQQPKVYSAQSIQDEITEMEKTELYRTKGEIRVGDCVESRSWAAPYFRGKRKVTKGYSGISVPLWELSGTARTYYSNELKVVPCD